MKPLPRVSICIPVKNTEPVLQKCLDSVAMQEFEGLEIILVNDNSRGKNEKGYSCKKIAGRFHRTSKIPLNYIEHYNYVPLNETRRQLVEAARGQYILMVDSDDQLAPGALQNLYKAAQESGADITCGQSKFFELQDDGELKFIKNILAIHSQGSIKDREILDSWLVRKESSGFLWAKLIKRDLYLKAFDSIPYLDCSFAEDTVIYFFLALYAKSYLGINETVYYYNYNTGTTAKKTITDLNQWERQCSAASNYTVMLQKTSLLTAEETAALQKLSRKTLFDTISRLNTLVDKSIYPQAYEILCEYWGKDFVEKMKSSTRQNNKNL